MGQLKDKRIVQSRIWLDPNPSPVPSYDYDYSYPISVYEAIKRNMEEGSPNLNDELDSIYRLIADKQNIVEAGTPGQVMSWTGMRGQIGSIEILKMINNDPSLRSHLKLLSERAIGELLDTKVPLKDFTAHVVDNSIHVTDIERNRWNSMAPMSTLNTHMNNSSMHITEIERGRWNNKADQKIVDDHIYDLNNPHHTSAHQVGTYTRQEIDDMFETLHDSFFNYLNIYWDDRQNTAELVEYHATNWNPNFVLKFEDNLPSVSDDSVIYFALKPATDYQTNESQDCIIYIKRPGMTWQEIGFQTMKVGDMVIKFPDTRMYVWVQGRFLNLFANGGSNGDGSGDPDDPDDPNSGGSGSSSDMMWRPVINQDTGELTWVRSKQSTPPSPYIIKGKDGYSPIKGIDYFDGKDGQGVPIGGLAGEVLVKMTNDNYDTTWRDIMDVLGDIIIGGGGLPAGIISWDMIKGRPEWYNSLGDNEDGFITQKAATRQFEIINNSISELLEKIIGNGGLDSIKEDIYDHVNDYSNPHRLTVTQIGAVPVATFNDHLQNFHNPHNVTAQQVGLGNVNNTSDLDKPISNAVQEALDDILDSIGVVTGDMSHINFIDNVHFNEANTTLTFVYKNGSEIIVQLPITDIFTQITFDPTTGELIIVLPNGDENRIDISSMIKTYTGSMSKQIQTEVTSDNSIKATIIPNTIGQDELKISVHLPGSPTTTTQPITDRSTRIATTEFVRNQVIDNIISYETDRPLSANMGRILNQRKVDINDIMEIINDLESIEVIDNLDSTNSLAALSANMGRFLDLTKAPRVHTSPSASTFGRANITLFGHTKASDTDPLMDGTVFRGTDNGEYARGDHRHPTDETRAPIHFPDVAHNQYSFTGEPRAPLPPDASNDTRLATTEWVRRNGAGVAFGTCNTPSTQPIKKVTLQSTFMDPPVFFLRQIGSCVTVTFTNTDTSGHSDENITMLDVQDTGPAIILYGGAYMTNGMIGRKYTHMFVFDGKYWRLMNPVAGTGENPTRGPEDGDIPDIEPEEQHVITFNANGGTLTGGVTTLKYYTNDTGRLDSFPDAQRDSYIFNGWFTSATGGNVIGTGYHFDNDMTLYAQWTFKIGTEITINLNAMGGLVSPSSIYTKPNIAIGNLPIPVYAGYDFIGWYDVPITGGNEINSSSKFTQNTTIYARWKSNKEGTPINQFSGYTGFTVIGDGSMDENGNCDYVIIAMKFDERHNDVRIDVSRGDNDFAILTGSGTQLRAFNQKILSTTRSSAIIQFQIEDFYPVSSPVQLMYRLSTAFINIIEIDENGDDINNTDGVADTPIIITSFLPQGRVGERYNFKIVATGETPIIFKIKSGTLPNGLTMNDAGQISGIPTTVGEKVVNIEAINNLGSISKSFTLNIDYAIVEE